MEVDEEKSSYKSIPLAAIFRPTEAEFQEPLDYINHIRPRAEKYGICKIIPPKTWSPKFCIDMNTFKFRPRIQRLNELEANNRIKINFLEKLSKFWDLQGKKCRVPTLEGRPVDIFKLYKVSFYFYCNSTILTSSKTSNISGLG
jgi:histone demethylase JARID1